MELIDIGLTIFLSLLMIGLCGYYIYIATHDNGGFDKSEFNRLVIYVMLFVLLILIVNRVEGIAIYFGSTLAALVALEKLGKINIGNTK